MKLKQLILDMTGITARREAEKQRQIKYEQAQKEVKLFIDRSAIVLTNLQTSEGLEIEKERMRSMTFDQYFDWMMGKE